MELDKHSFNREGYNPDNYFNFKRAVGEALEKLRVANLYLTGYTSPEIEAYKIIVEAAHQLKRIEFKD